MRLAQKVIVTLAVFASGCYSKTDKSNSGERVENHDSGNSTGRSDADVYTKIDENRSSENVEYIDSSNSTRYSDAGGVGGTGGADNTDRGLADANIGDAEPSEYGCKLVRARVLSSLDEVSPLGFSAADILEFIETTFNSPMEWQSAAGVMVGSRSGQSEVTITVRYAGGNIAYADYELFSDRMWEVFEPCFDAIEIDVTVTISTSDGALNEQFDATLSADGPHTARINTDLALDGLDGELTLLPREDFWTIFPINVNVLLTPLGMTGTLTSGVVRSRVSKARPDQIITLAYWPNDHRCRPYDQVAADLDTIYKEASARDAIDILTSSEGLRLVWSSGVSTDLTFAFEPDVQRVCVSLEFVQIDSAYFPGEIHLSGILSVTTADGRVNDAYDINLVATLGESGGLSSVKFDTSAAYDNVVSVDAFETTYGISGVDVTGYDETGVYLYGTFTISDETIVADGELQVLGVTVPECIGPTPGCGFRETAPIESASAIWQIE